MKSASRLATPTRAPFRKVVATAPMRVSFAGGGSDLPPFLPGVGGRIVGTAIDLRVKATVEPFDRGWVRLEAPGVPGGVLRRVDEAPIVSVELRLLEAALVRAGVTEGVSLSIATHVMPGAGLGGSASAAVALLCALRASLGEDEAAGDLARDAIGLERDGLRLACGSQDQVFAACGGYGDISFDDHGGLEATAIDPPAQIARELGEGLLLVDTLVRRVSGDVIHRIDRRAQLESTAELVEAAGDVAKALAEGSLSDVLEGMRRSARAKLRRDPEGSRVAVELEAKLGGLGAEVVRVCGAGGGGHVLVWARPERHAAILEAAGASRVRRPTLGAPGVRIEADETPSRRLSIAPLTP